ncbi:hypothetical protein MYA98_07775 [Salmonella sp. WGH-01]|nr:hypothetical protein MYA98_07775 [Salmonella sp. WGH-01]
MRQRIAAGVFTVTLSWSVSPFFTFTACSLFSSYHNDVFTGSMVMEAAVGLSLARQLT